MLVLGSTQPPVPRIRGLFSRVEWPGREANHTPPFSCQVRNECNSTSAPPICFHGKEREDLTFFMGVKLGLFYEGTLRLQSVALSSIRGWKLWLEKGFMICIYLIRILKQLA